MSSSVALAGLGLVMLLLFRHELGASTTDDLSSRATRLAEDIAQVGPSALETPTSGDLLRPQGAFAQLLASDGRVLARSATAPTAALVPAGTHGTVTVGHGDANRIRAVLRTTPAGTLVVARSLHDVDRADQAFANATLFGGPLVLFLVYVSTRVVVGRALEPVRGMTRAAQHATMSDRLPVPVGRDTLSELAVTLNSLLDRVEQAAAHEHTFVADASHELRTPLARLQLGLELALSGPTTYGALHEAATGAVDEIRRLGTLAADLLGLASLRDSPEPDLSPTDLHELIGSIAARHDGTDGRTVATRTTPVVVDVDSLRLEQAIDNLVRNALVHGSGTVTISAAQDADACRVTVADQGPGLDLPLPQATDRFTRGPRASNRPGSGLGLAYANAVALSHGGRLETTSRPCRVTIVIPRPPA